MEQNINYDALLLHTITRALTYERSSPTFKSLENVDALKGLQGLLLNRSLNELDDKTLLNQRIERISSFLFSNNCYGSERLLKYSSNLSFSTSNSTPNTLLN